MCQRGKIRLFLGTFDSILRKKTGISVIRKVSLELPLTFPAAMWEISLRMKPTQREAKLSDGK